MRLFTRRILQPGKNCGRVARADRLAFLIDAKNYFDALVHTMQGARQKIVILGWNFDSRMLPRPDCDQRSFGDLIRECLDRNPELHFYLLIWRNSLWYTDGLDVSLLFGSEWASHPRVHIVLDNTHAVGACFHEKIVLIDDRLAYVGGIDVKQRCWDDQQHSLEQKLRVDRSGEPYHAVHDVQAMVEGDAALLVADHVQERWRHATGEELPPVTATWPLWPISVEPDLRECDVALSRTRAPYNGTAGLREAELLNINALRAARRSIYIESQYFALRAVERVLAAHLQRNDGPEIVIVTTWESGGVVEQYVMAQNRDYLFAKLRAADRYRRLRLYCVTHDGDLKHEIKIHTKLMIVDDRFARVGSSNLNQRSSGMDSEVDLAFEASAPHCRLAIARLRNHLVAEHMNVERGALEAAIEQGGGSLLAAIDALNSRRGKGFAEVPKTDALKSGRAPLSDVLDPRGPFSVQTVWRSLFG